MILRAIAPGPLATVQDHGRYGFRAFGVPTSGPFDRRSAAIANVLVGNDPQAAVLELTGFGGIYEFEPCDTEPNGPSMLSLAGAPMAARIEGVNGGRRALRTPGAFPLRAGDRLILGACMDGYRSYLAVAGGWLAPQTLGSRCCEAPLTAGDALCCQAQSVGSRFHTDLGQLPKDDGPLRFLDGPDAAEVDVGILERADFLIDGESDRMGLRLIGPSIATTTRSDRLSIAVAPGAIQIAGGRPIVLGPASGTMGGYPVAGVVLSADLERLGQLRPGSVVRFRRVEAAEAWRIDRSRRADLAGIVLCLTSAISGLIPALPETGV